MLSSSSVILHQSNIILGSSRSWRRRRRGQRQQQRQQMQQQRRRQQQQQQQESDCNNLLSFITYKTLYNNTATAPVVFISYSSVYVDVIVKSWFPRVQIDYSNIPLTVEIRDKSFSSNKHFVVWMTSTRLVT
jgi:hypothetical protein